MNLRVTQSMIDQNMLRNISKSYREMGKLQNDIATGRRLHKPSDDPIGTMQAMNYRTQIMENDTFRKNADDAKGWLETADGVMMQTHNIFGRIKELMVQVSNDINNEYNRQAISQEIQALKEELGSAANTSLNGKYIFAGTQTDQPPYQDGVLINGNSEPIQVEISKNNYVPMNVTAQEMFGDEQTGLFPLLDQIITDLNDTSKSGKDLNQYIDRVDQQSSQFSSVQAILGSRVNRIEQATNRLESQDFQLTKMLSETEDTDLAKAITDLTSQETIHKAALQSGASIMQQTLMDFLR